jgi:23S rRNA (adenine2503-C2)-methyltransferase
MTTPSAKLDIRSMSREEIADLLASLSQPAFRTKQVFSWLQQKRVSSFDEMTNLPAALRQALDERCEIITLKEKRRQTASDGTVKFLFELPDGNTIESVLMRHDYGNSLCISSQVGCRMGCRFCASTIGGKVRDLRPSEMLGQIDAAGRLSGLSIDSIVMMGIGEPLDNFDNVIRFLELLRDPDGFALSHRHVSLSTCGVVPRIDELAQKRYQLTLSVSLHACDNETRDKIMPVNHSYPIEELMAACKRYFAATGRRISYEYSLIAGVNDSPGQAKKLCALLKGQACHVNLIPVNPVTETGFRRGSRESAERFCNILNQNGLTATIRREFGTEIDAACGQLRRREQQQGGEPSCG